MNKKNLTTEELLWKIYESTEKTRKHLMWSRVFSVIKILIIVIPIVLAIILIPPYIDKITKPYENLLENNAQGFFENLDLEEVLKFYNK